MLILMIFWYIVLMGFSQYDFLIFTASFSGAKLRDALILTVYTKSFCNHEIYHCHYAILGHHGNELGGTW
jgi:hypothetical protein